MVALQLFHLTQGWQPVKMPLSFGVNFLGQKTERFFERKNEPF